jgi:hypothetical protein
MFRFPLVIKQITKYYPSYFFIKANSRKTQGREQFKRRPCSLAFGAHECSRGCHSCKRQKERPAHWPPSRQGLLPSGDWRCLRSRRLLSPATKGIHRELPATFLAESFAVCVSLFLSLGEVSPTFSRLSSPLSFDLLKEIVLLMMLLLRVR